jgi:hypothetical protein
MKLASLDLSVIPTNNTLLQRFGYESLAGECLQSMPNYFIKSLVDHG